MKKISTILSVFIFLILPSFLFVGCGDKYKNMSIEVQYYQCRMEGDEIKGEWVAIDSNSGSENYGLNFVLNNIYKENPEDSYYTLKCRVIVKGTKKDIGDILVSVTGASVLQLDSSSVVAEEVFKIKIFETGSAKLTFIPSVKSDKTTVEFPINLYKELGEISPTESYTPAVAKSGELLLNNLTDLIDYKPVKVDGVSSGQTNQLGVKFSIEGCEIDQDEKYSLYNGDKLIATLETKNNINRLYVTKDCELTQIPLKATSVYSYKTSENKEISCLFNVAVVENVDRFYMNYESDYKENILTGINTIELFPYTTYNTSTLILSGVCDSENLYDFDVNKSNHYSVSIFVDGKNITNQAGPYNGLSIVEDSDKSTNKIKAYQITASPYESSTVNEVRFVVGFENLKFTGKSYNLENSVLTYTINVIRTSLPKNVIVNDVVRNDGDSVSDILYTEYSTENRGLKLKISALKATEIEMSIHTDINMENDYGDYIGIIPSSNGTQLTGSNNKYILKDINNSLYFKFADESKNYPSVVYIKLNVLASPLYFEGREISGEKSYITVKVILNVVGSLKNVKLQDTEGNNNLFDSDSEPKTLKGNSNYVSYLSLTSSGNIPVDSQTVRISSQEKNIVFSADGKDFYEEIQCDKLIRNQGSYKLYFKSNSKLNDRIIITTSNMLKFESKVIKFVDVVDDNISLNYNQSSVYTAGKESNYYNGYEGHYFALQLSRNVDFYFMDSNNKTAGISSVDVNRLTVSEANGLEKTFNAYGTGAVSVTKFSNGFNVVANIPNLTTLLKVDINYYNAESDYNIVSKTKTIYMEIAVYVPVTSLDFDIDNSEIYYINNIISDTSTANINVAVDMNASSHVYFSDSTINSKLNSEVNNKIGSIYSIKVNIEVPNSLNVSSEGLIGETYWLDLLHSNYSIKVNDSVDEDKYIILTFTVVGLCQDFNNLSTAGYTQVYRKSIKVAKTTKSNSIRVEGTFKGNVYLSLNGEKEASFSARILPNNATYKSLSYQLYNFDSSKTENHYCGDKIVSDVMNIQILPDTNQVKINVNNNIKTGGKFVLRLVSLDSYNGSDYTVNSYIIITVSDGSETNPYYIYKLEDLKNISSQPTKHYVLASDINLSSLSNAICDTFSGSINGMATIYNADNNLVLHTQYKLTNLTIRSDFLAYSDNEKNCYGLFGINNGIIKNLIIENAKIDLTISGGEVKSAIKIGVLAGENKADIINSSVILNSSTINIEASGNTNYESYNIGALVGANWGTIDFYSNGNDSLKPYALSAQLVENTQSFNVNLTSLAQSTSINFGGITGYNEGDIKANYFDYNNKGKTFKDYLTGKINMSLDIASSVSSSLYTANVGGAVGSVKSNSVTNLALTGNISVKGDKINLGGIVGNNNARISDSTSYAMNLTAEAQEGQTLNSQIVGGIAGVSNGTIENVYVLFLDLSSLGYTNKGQIKGGTIAGGVVGELSGGSITYGNVQTFLNHEYNITSQSQVGGIVGNQTAGSLSLSYAQVNISTTGEAYSLSNGTVENSYFVGLITATNIYPCSNSNCYSLILGADGQTGSLYYKGSIESYYKNENGQASWYTSNDYSTPIEGVKPIVDLNSANWDSENYLDYNLKLPVIIKDGVPTLYILPSQMITEIKDNIFKVEGTQEEKENVTIIKNDNGIYLKNNNVITAIVFLSDNEYDLIGDDGLISMKVIPSLATKEYTYRIIDGQDKFSLTDNKIRFLKTGRVEIEFYSLFNKTVSDKVIFFIEEPINDLQISKGGLSINKLNLYSGDDIVLNLQALFGEKLSNIDLAKLYLTVSAKDKKDVSIDIDNNDVIDLSALAGSSDGKLSFGEIGIKAKTNGELTLTFELYLDLSKYAYIDTSLFAKLGIGGILIKEFTLVLDINPSATDLKVNTSDKTIGMGETVNISIDMTTDYRDSDNSEKTISEFNISNNYLKPIVSGKDSVYCLIETDENTMNDLISASININSLWDLFNYKLTYRLNTTKTGYEYNFEINLKEEYRNIFRADRQFVFTFFANSNNVIFESFTLNLQPHEITSLRIDNYKLGGAYKDGDETIIEYSSSETPSSIIVPGASGLLKIYVEPSYALVDKIIISSEPISANGKTYKVRFEQMIYDKHRKCYVSIATGIMNDDDNSLNLKKVSFKEVDGSESYTGVIYVRTILASDEEIVGLSETFNVVVKAVVYERDSEGNVLSDSIKRERVVNKLLKSQYNPGVSFENIENAIKIQNAEYIVSKNVNSLQIKAKIYGYELNSVPYINISWKDDTTTGISNYISYSASNAILQLDGSYLVTYNLNIKNLEKAFKFSMSVSIISEGAILDSITKSLTFYPADYLPSKVYLKKSASNVLRVGVNSSSNLDLVWLNSDDAELDSITLNKKLSALDTGKDASSPSSLFYTLSYNDSGEERAYLKFNENDNKFYKLTLNNSTYNIEGLGEYYQTIYFEVKYGFTESADKNAYEITFGTGEYTINYSFVLDIRVETSEEDPDPVYNEDDFKARLTDGAILILMNDLVLENWTPITAKINSLDGNNKTIKIKSFAIPTSSTEIIGGLFATIQKDTIVKNLTIDLSDYSGNADDYQVSLSDENAKDAITYFGFLAGKNEGNIYNSEIINTKDSKAITIATSSKTSYIGGLVGSNSGNITNSRFGSAYFLRLDIDSNGVVSENQNVETKTISISGSGIMGGLVAINEPNGIISSSYFYKANLINKNTITVDDYNKTAGLVAVNSNGAKVLNSYVKGTGISSTNIRGTGTKIESVGAGSVAGFVFDNAGTIENCYSNISVESSASGVAGFVYRNDSQGVISKSYSASKVTSNASGVTYATQLPFVGVGIDGSEHNTLLSYGKLENCYYLKLTSDEFSKNYDYYGNELAYALDPTNFANSENLVNFAFVNGDSEQEYHGVWTYYQTMDKYNKGAMDIGKTILPELTSANQISRSIRGIKPSTNDSERQTYIYGKGYELGSYNNPYIIRDAEEYNAVFSLSYSHLNVLTGSIRLISDISFWINESEGTTTSINSTNGYILGDSQNHNLTVLDGNGMTIEGVNIKNYDTPTQTSVGLFSEIYYSIIKNVNIQYANMDYTSTKAVYSGGLAGRIVDSFVIGLTISGKDSTIFAQNFSGGLAGIVLGNSGLYDIKVDINVKTGYEELSSFNQYLSKSNFENYATKLGYSTSNYSDYLKKLSYAGGVAGVIDINSSAEFASRPNVVKVSVGENHSAQIVADIAGYVAGYLGRGVYASRLKSVVSLNSYVFGAYISGGLVGENYGVIQYSQVASTDEAQDEYDSKFAQYILTLNNNEMINTNNAYGNLSFVRGSSKINNCSNYAGGLIGVNYGGSVSNSYTKGNINANSKFIGGLVGVTFGGMFESVYAENYVNLSTIDNKNTLYVGGFSACNNVKSLDGVGKFYSVLNYGLSSDIRLIMDNVVISTFYDKNQLENVDEKVKIAYLLAKSGNEIASNQGEGSVSINVYYLSYNNLNTIYKDKISSEILSLTSDTTLASDKHSITADSKSVENLYDLSYEKQSDVFDALFANFDENIWDKSGNAHEKFMPKLTDKSAVNYYEIKTEQDLMLIQLHPDADFKLIGNINMSSERVNYVLDVTFTGTLVGELSDEGQMPSITGIKIYTDDNTSSAGFFRETKGAIISNISFVYDYLIVNNNNGKDYVGLLSANDKESEFSGISISTNTNLLVGAEGSITSKAGSFNLAENYNNSQITVVKEGKVNVFGGLVANSQSSKIVTAKINLNINMISNNSKPGYFGGIVGYACGTGSNKIDYIIKSSSFAGNIYLQDYTHMGGLVGYAQFANISNSSVKINTEKDDAFTIKSSSNSYFGGVVGSQFNSYLTAVNAVIVLNKLSNINTQEIQLNIGGISGFVSNDDLDRDADIDYSTVKLVLNSTEDPSNLAVVFGGLISTVAKNVKINSSVAWISGQLSANAIYFGGAVGQVSENTRVISINETFVYVEKINATTASPVDVDASGLILKSTNICAAGFYGIINSNKAIVSTKNSNVAGAIWAENNTESKTLIMGGLVGSWGREDGELDFTQSREIYEIDGVTVKEKYQTIFDNVYTTVALESSGYKMGGIDYDVNALIGKFVSKNINGLLTVKNLYYSSDLNIAVEEKDVFKDEDNSFKNLLAGSFYEEEQKKYYFSDRGWSVNVFGLPYRMSLVDIMSNMGLMNMFSKKGTSLNPNWLKETETDNYEFNSSTYQYYYISKTSLDKLASDDSERKALHLHGTLKGFLIGGGAVIMDYAPSMLNTITSSSSLKIERHSVVSNLDIQINYTNKFKNTTEPNGGLANINNGTIFNVMIDYHSKEELICYGGGLVGTNDGNILYCYNTGALEKISGSNYFGGICNENTETGFIYSTGFVGALIGSSKVYAGICVNNIGSISNCYSAGVITTSGAYSTLVKDNGGIIRNCYYDKYANCEFDDLWSEDNQTQYIKPLTTKELQTETSKFLKGNFITYLMNATEDDNKNLILSDCYNYGYPVYTIKQNYYAGNVNVEFFKKGLFTGNGSKENPYLISNIGTLESINTLIRTDGLYFTLVNDLNFNKNDKNSTYDTGICKKWEGVGSIESDTVDVSGAPKKIKSASFSGVFSGGYRKSGIWIPYTNELGEVNRVIKNITGESGLFNELGANAEISNLVFNGAILSKDGSIGALTNIIGGEEGQVKLKKIGFKEGDIKITGSNIGGLVGQISSGMTLSLTNFNTVSGSGSSSDFGSKVAIYSSEEKNGNMALIAGANEGTLNISDSLIVDGTTVGVKTINADSANTVGAIVGQNNGILNLENMRISGVTVGALEKVGTIVGQSEGTIKLSDGCQIGASNPVSLEIYGTTTSYMGGLVGVLKGELNINPTNTEDFAPSINLGSKTDEDSKNKIAKYAGGIAGYSSSNIKGFGKVNVNINLIRAREYAGGVVGRLEGGAIAGIKVSFGNEASDCYASLGVGGIVGYMDSGSIGKDSSEGTESAEESMVSVEGVIKLVDTSAVGGAVAIINGDGCSIQNVDLSNLSSINVTTSLDATISGDIGIGGLIGVVNNSTSIGSIKLSGTEINADRNYKNIGGIFGHLKTNTLSKAGDDDKIEVSDLTVRGVQNVGGFAGAYSYSDSEAGDEASPLKVSEAISKLFIDTTSTEGFATIELSNSENNMLGEEDADAKNFGGLFGAYNATGSLGYIILSNSTSSTDPAEGEGETTTNVLPFYNSNKVLYSTQTDKSFEGFVNSSKTTIKNVGGIAGVAYTQNVKGVNKAKIGSSNGDNPKYNNLSSNELRLLSIYHMTNVGGLVGYLDVSNANDLIIKNVKLDKSATVSGYDNVGGLIGKVFAQQNVKFGIQDELTASENDNVYVESTINGIYNVGGIIGDLNANGIVELISKQEEAVTVSVKINSRKNVGGLFGVIKCGSGTEEGEGSAQESSIKGINLTSEIIGLINVGGFVGQINNAKMNISANYMSDIEGAGDVIGEYELEVKGNANVGGVVGHAIHETDKYLTIDGLDLKNLKIKATDYEHSASGDNKTIYLPTSVGGLVGYGNNIKITNCKMSGEIVYSKPDSDEGEPLEQISTLQNYVVEEGGEDYKASADARSYASIATGIGGFVGTFKPNTNDNGLIGITGSKTFVNIDVENGINVGGVIGYCFLNKTFAKVNNLSNDLIGGKVSTGQFDEAGNPIMKEKTVYIAGGMGVGGFFGRLESNNLIEAFHEVKFNSLAIQARLEKDVNTGNETTKPLFGEYVGGFVGRSSSLDYANIKNQDDSAGLKIYNDNGGYYGGIIGFLDGNLSGGKGQGENMTYYSTVPDSGLFNNEDNHNYGGLVGAVNATGTDVNVLGYHKYDFTVDTVKIQNLTMTEGNFDYDTDGKNIILMGLATLNTKLNIAQSAQNFYREDIQVKPNEATNPLLKNGGITTGWSKEYTMFKTIEMDSYAGLILKSSQVVYDAKYIEEVYSDGNSYDSPVTYTIYNVNGQAVMYTRFGIATATSSNSATFAEDQAKLLLGTYDKSKTIAEQLGIKNFEVVDVTDRLTTTDPINYDKELTGSFKNFRSEKVYINWINTEEIKFNFKNDFTLSMYKILPKMSNGLYKDRVFKVDTIFATVSANNYYLFHETQRPAENGGLTSEKWAAGDYGMITPGVNENDWQMACSWNLCNSGSLFDISGKMIGRTPDNVYPAPKNTPLGILIVLGVAAGILLIMGIGLIAGTAGLAVGAVAGALTLVSITLGGLYVYSSLFANQALHVESTQKYVFNTYEGDYGVLSQIYSRPWYFENGYLVNEIDDVVYYETKVVPTEGESRTENVPYMYISKSRPNDVNASITIENDYTSNSSIAKLTLNTGDTMQKYCYYNGQYYINLFALKTTKSYISGLEIPSNIESQPYILKNNGLLYVGAEVEITQDGVTISQNGVTITQGDVTIIDGSKVNTSEFTTKDLYFSYQNKTILGTDVPGYNYIEMSGRDMNWRISESVNTENPKDIGRHFEYYVYELKNGDIGYSDEDNLTYFDYGSYIIETISKKTCYIHATRERPTSDTADLSSYGGIYKGEDIISAMESVDKDYMRAFKVKKAINDSYILNYSSNGYGICQKRTYYLYDSGLGVGYLFDDSDDTSVNKNYPLVPIDDNTKAQRLYDVSGNTTTVGALMDTITSNDELKKWYVEDVSKLGTDDVSKETKNLYCATNYFRYYKASSSEKGALYKYDKGYTVDSNLGTDSEGNTIRQRVKTLIDYSEFNLAENKYKIRVGNVYVYTRYAYKSVQYANLTNGLTKQLADGSYKNYKPLPSNGNGYGDEYFSDYNFSEVIMLNYGGKIKRVSITSGAMANLDS